MFTASPSVPSERVDSDWTSGVHMAHRREMVVGSLRWPPTRDSAQSHWSHQLIKED